jgi:hypothetical protein
MSGILFGRLVLPCPVIVVGAAQRGRAHIMQLYLVV